MKLCILTAVYKRPQIFSLFLRQLAPAFEHFDATLVVAGHEAEHKKMLRSTRFPFVWVESPNKPLGEKWNRALEKARELQPDYVIVLGSDDVMSPGLWALYSRLTSERFHYIALEDMFVVDSRTSKAKYFSGYKKERKGHALGAGRMVHKNVLDILKWELWEPSANKGLDLSMDIKFSWLKMNRCIINARDYGEALVDIKSDTNIWGIEAWKGEEVSLAEINSKFEHSVIDEAQQKPRKQSRKPSPKICVVSCAWKRPELTRLFAKQLQRLEEECRTDNVLVVSEGERYEGANCFDFPNNPLGAKWNEALRIAIERGADYCLVLGSDDFISSELVRHYIDALVMAPHLDVLGILDGYFLDQKSGRLVYWQGYEGERFGVYVGMGRLVSREAILKLGGKLFNSKANKGLDATLDKSLTRLNIKRLKLYCKEIGAAVDVKYKENITSFDHFKDSKLASFADIVSIPELVDILAL